MKTITLNGIEAEVHDEWADRIERIVGYRKAREGERYLSSGRVYCWPAEITADPYLIVKLKRWRAEYGGAYWFVNEWGEARKAVDAGDAIPHRYHAAGNYFQTKTEAESSHIAEGYRKQREAI